MNTLKITKYVVITLLLLAFAGCDSILENVEPSTSVSGEVALSSPEGVTAIRASMYSKIRASFSMTTDYFVGPSAFTDELRRRPGATRFQAYNLASDTEQVRAHMTPFSTSNVNNVYNIIQDANLLIGAIPEGVVPAATRDRIRGEALAIRAFIMHHLVRAYGYEPNNFGVGDLNATWDLGVIIRTEPVLSLADADFRPRSTVNEVYTQIFTDLNEARSLLSGITGNTFANEAFVDAVAARASLYAGNWGDAANFAQDAINKSGRSLETTAAGVAGMFFENDGNHPEAIFKIVVNSDTEASTGGGSFINSGPAAYTSDQWVSQIPTQFLIDKYEQDDYRLAGWYRHCREARRIGTIPGVGACESINDGGFAITKFNGVKGNAVDDLPYMRIGEMYLIWAEGAYKSGQQADGIAALETLRNARNAGSTPNSFANIEVFEDFILDERMRELAVEGHRFYDLKRLARDVRNPNGTLKFSRSSHRILSLIGTSLLNINDELVENPGY